MKNRLYCKILAVGIIVLFLGVSVFPIISAEKINLSADKTESSVDLYVNHLGYIGITHNILSCKVHFGKVDNLDFNFPVENGKVYLNFTVWVGHISEQEAYTFRKILGHKTSCVVMVATKEDIAIVFAGGELYEMCDQEGSEEFIMNVDYNSGLVDAILELEVGEYKELGVYFFMWPSICPFPDVFKEPICWDGWIRGLRIFPLRGLSLFIWPECFFTITVNGI